MVTLRIIISVDLDFINPVRLTEASKEMSEGLRPYKASCGDVAISCRVSVLGIQGAERLRV